MIDPHMLVQISAEQQVQNNGLTRSPVHAWSRKCSKAPAPSLLLHVCNPTHISAAVTALTLLQPHVGTLSVGRVRPFLHVIIAHSCDEKAPDPHRLSFLFFVQVSKQSFLINAGKVLLLPAHSPFHTHLHCLARTA